MALIDIEKLNVVNINMQREITITVEEAEIFDRLLIENMKREKLRKYTLCGCVKSMFIRHKLFEKRFNNINMW